MDRLEDRFVGALLGLMVGDALGRSAKDRDPRELAERPEIGQEMLGGFCTEDTEMTFAILESLLAQGGIKPDDVAQRLGQGLNPMRGYNPGALEVLYKLQQGLDWRDANRVVFEDGSYGMGASCRATPVGLYYHDDPEALIAAARTSAHVTHAHPIGEAGAVVVALMVGYGAFGGSPAEGLAEVRARLPEAGFGMFLPFLALLEDLLGQEAGPVEAAGVLGNVLTAQACVPAAIYCALRFPDDYEHAVGLAACMGGDADTIAAIAGAMIGAYRGAAAIPRRWLDQIENVEHGRDEMRDLARNLYAAWQMRQLG